MRGARTTSAGRGAGEGAVRAGAAGRGGGARAARDDDPARPRAAREGAASAARAGARGGSSGAYPPREDPDEDGREDGDDEGADFDDEGGEPEPGSKRRREVHNMAEQRRARRIAEQIDILRTLMQEDGRTVRKDKFSVLSSVVDYLENLKARNGALPDGSSAVVAAPSRALGPAATRGTPAMALPPGVEGVVDYESVFRNGAVAQAVAGMDGHFLDCNRLFCALTGYRREEVKKRSIFSLTPTEDLQRTFALVTDMMGKSGDGRGAPGMETKQFRKLCKMKDGIADVYVSMSLVRNAEGMPEHFACAVIPMRPLIEFTEAASKDSSSDRDEQSPSAAAEDDGAPPAPTHAVRRSSGGGRALESIRYDDDAETGGGASDPLSQLRVDASRTATASRGAIPASSATSSSSSSSSSSSPSSSARPHLSFSTPATVESTFGHGLLSPAVPGAVREFGPCEPGDPDCFNELLGALTGERQDGHVTKLDPGRWGVAPLASFHRYPGVPSSHSPTAPDAPTASMGATESARVAALSRTMDGAGSGEGSPSSPEEARSSSRSSSSHSSLGSRGPSTAPPTTISPAPSSRVSLAPVSSAATTTSVPPSHHSGSHHSGSHSSVSGSGGASSSPHEAPILSTQSGAVIVGSFHPSGLAGNYVATLTPTWGAPPPSSSSFSSSAPSGMPTGNPFASAPAMIHSSAAMTATTPLPTPTTLMGLGSPAPFAGPRVVFGAHHPPHPPVGSAGPHLSPPPSMPAPASSAYPPFGPYDTPSTTAAHPVGSGAAHSLPAPPALPASVLGSASPYEHHGRYFPSYGSGVRVGGSGGDGPVTGTPVGSADADWGASGEYGHSLTSPSGPSMASPRGTGLSMDGRPGAGDVRGAPGIRDMSESSALEGAGNVSIPGMSSIPSHWFGSGPEPFVSGNLSIMSETALRELQAELDLDHAGLSDPTPVHSGRAMFSSEEH